MKIIAILGSPRAKSNSTALARTILSATAERGAEIQEFQLNKLNYKGCQACETCKTKLDRCVLKDDLTAVLDAIREADAVIFASPNYFSEVSGQFKTFFDRTYSFVAPDFSSRLQAGKRSVFIFAQGQSSLDLYADVYPRYEMWLTRFGFSERHLLRMNGPRPADSAPSRSDLMEQARKIAESLMA